MKFTPTLLITLILSLAVPTLGKTDSNKGAPPKKLHDLKTEIEFDGMSLKGKYQTSTGLVTTVEDEKELNKILKLKTHFRDRILQSLKENGRR